MFCTGKGNCSLCPHSRAELAGLVIQAQIRAGNCTGVGYMCKHENK